MAVTSLLIANPQGVYFGEPSDTFVHSDLSEMNGILDDATITEEDTETTEFAALIGSSNLYISKTLGSISVELTLAEIYPSQFTALTGYTYSNGVLQRPTSAPTIYKKLAIEFEGGIVSILHKADIAAKLADMDIKTGLMSVTLTCTGQDYIDEDGVRYNYSLVTPDFVDPDADE